MIYSLTASLYDYNNKYLLIDYMIHSCLSNSINKCFISISFFNLESLYKYQKYIDILINKYKDKIFIYTHIYKMTQFEQLLFLSDFLYSNKYIDPIDKILFIDDDDLLLHLPDIHSNNIIPGWQYLSPFVETDFTKFFIKKEIINMAPCWDNWRIVNDFSGYICSFQDLLDFFITHHFNFTTTDPVEKFLLNLIDTQFMNFLDKKLEGPQSILGRRKPFIFHRIWSVKERPISTWRVKF